MNIDPLANTDQNKQVPISTKSPEEILDQHYKTVYSSQFKATEPIIKEEFSSTYKTDFAKASSDYWARQGSISLSEYNKGYMSGGYTNNSQNINELFRSLLEMIKIISETECKNNNNTAEDLKENFKCIDAAFKVLAKSVTEKNPKSNFKALHAFIHGYLNSSIEASSK